MTGFVVFLKEYIYIYIYILFYVLAAIVMHMAAGLKGVNLYVEIDNCCGYLS